MTTKLLAIVAYAGSKKLVRMTEDMLRSFQECARKAGVEYAIVAINNAAEDTIAKGLYDWHGWNKENEGFGRAVNLGIQAEFDLEKAGHKVDYTHVLVLNNDLEFPDQDWLGAMMAEVEPGLVLSPCTDVTATKVAVAAAARDSAPVRAPQVSAFCWLVPKSAILKIRRKFGWNLFHPDFSNYGSDDVTGAVLRKLVDPKPFKVVPRAWVRHKKAQTANELGIRAGDPNVLRRIAHFKHTWKLQ